MSARKTFSEVFPEEFRNLFPKHFQKVSLNYFLTTLSPNHFLRRSQKYFPMHSLKLCLKHCPRQSPNHSQWHFSKHCPWHSSRFSKKHCPRVSTRHSSNHYQKHLGKHSVFGAFPKPFTFLCFTFFHSRLCQSYIPTSVWIYIFKAIIFTYVYCFYHFVFENYHLLFTIFIMHMEFTICVV